MFNVEKNYTPFDVWCGEKLYSYENELFKLELFICIKMDLALNNLQGLICHKTQRNKQTNKKSWCNVYHCKKWIWWHEFKSWMILFAFHIVPIPAGKVWIQLFFLLLWPNSRADWYLYPWYCNQSRRRKTLDFKPLKLHLKNWPCVTSCLCWGVGKYIHTYIHTYIYLYIFIQPLLPPAGSDRKPVC